MERALLRHYRLHTLSLILMWIGAIEIAGSFMAHVWFQFNIKSTPYFFLSLLVGIVLYVVARIL